MIALMMYAVLVAAMVGLAALLTDRGLRRAGVAGRWTWVGAIVLSVALPVVALWRPDAKAARTSDQPATTPVVTTTIDPAMLATRDLSFGERLAARADAARRTVERTRMQLGRLETSAPANRAALAVWLVASLAMLGTILTAAVRLATARRTWALAMLDEQPVRVSEDVGPAVVGFLRGEIVVPEWTLELTAERRELLLAHEREHLQARDPLVLLGALGALVLMPWNPAMWWQVRRLRLAVEMDCDRRVLLRGRDVRAYGALLIEVGRRSARAPLAAAAFSESTTHLERRIHMMLARPPRWSVLRATALTVAGVVVTLVACDMRPPTGIAPEKEVAVAALAATGRSYNVKEGSTLTDIRAAVEAHHPELLQAQDGRTWVVQLTLDPSGRVIGSGKMLDRPASAVELRPTMRVAGRPTALVRVPEGELVFARDRIPVAEEVEVAKARGEVVLLTAVDTTRLQAERMEIRPFEATVRMREAGGAPRLEATVLDTRPPTSEVEVRAGQRLRVEEPAGTLELERIDAERIESIEVIKGGAITGLSPAVSGVIVIRVKW